MSIFGYKVVRNYVNTNVQCSCMPSFFRIQCTYFFTKYTFLNFIYMFHKDTVLLSTCSAWCVEFLAVPFFFTNMCYKKGKTVDSYQESDKRGEKPHSTAGDSSLRRYHHQQLQLFSASCPQQLPHFLEPFTSLSSWHNSARAAPVLSICHISKRLQTLLSSC